MATVDRQTTIDLAERLLADARNYSYFRLLEHLHDLHGDDLEGLIPSRKAHGRLRLHTSPALAFPASDVVSAARLGETERYRVQASFFGLHGSDSPLPGYYLDAMAWEHAQGEGIQVAFLDYFNHRLLGLLHQGWRKYRYYLRFQEQAKDRFSRYVFALIGLNDEQLRGSTALPWGRLLSFAGVIASRSRAPATVAGIIAHCFDLPQVSIREFEVRKVAIAPGQRNALGRANCALGHSLVAGEHVFTRSSKFTVVIDELTQSRFREFLPSGLNYPRLASLIEFLLRDATAYDLELRLQPEAAPPFSLQREQGSHLGWTTFVPGSAAVQQPRLRIQVRA
ncbi:type VI secretion system baseplate subunit TssG [Pseudomonas sp. HR96]|uniref:type VI secretion system baseplate subunit TssG n=1 Tax=Pseudomonas sp. HR96 TaxID=1027966 RepID=UPI002A762CAB|nr:type VI secretion system baseplate subunit TssG [Pseudomonas sp. HR96]WPO98787.1 type VI secretion system baseplate subunit TssG [Pseudomonas sp. HR96]